MEENAYENFYEDIYKQLPAEFTARVKHPAKANISRVRCRLDFIFACLQTARKWGYTDIEGKIIDYVAGKPIARRLRMFEALLGKKEERK